jgi:hypothetical protein
MSKKKDEKVEDKTDTRDDTVLGELMGGNTNQNSETSHVVEATSSEQSETKRHDADDNTGTCSNTVDGIELNIDGNMEDDDDEEMERSESSTKHRKRKRRVYNGMIECNVEPIRALLTCTLCEGLYREPYTTLKCFHTFCKSCLITAIRASYNTPQYNCCPICQTYFGRDDVVTSNALPDRVLETLIDRVLFPHLSYQDHLLECEFYRKRNILQKENLSSTTTPLTPAIATGSTGITKGMVTETVTGNATVTASEVSDSNHHQGSNIQTRIFDGKVSRSAPKTLLLNVEKDQQITFHLVPHPANRLVDPQLPTLKLPFFRTSAQMRVEHIQKLLHLKLFPNLTRNCTVPTQKQFEIYCNGCLLEEELSLNFIYHVIWRVDTNHPNDNNDEKGCNSNLNEKTPTTLTLEYKCTSPPDQADTEEVMEYL